MSINRNYISSTQVASSVPFDNSTSHGYVGSDVQTALEELRDHTIYDSRTQATSTNGTLTLTSTDVNLQYLTGSATGYSVVLPDATTLSIGAYYQIINSTSQTVHVKDSSGTLLLDVGQNSLGFFTLRLNGSAAGTWIPWQTLANASGIINYNVTSTTTFTTTSTTDVVITGFTVTPQAGTYGIWYNGSSTQTTTPKTHWWSIYVAGSQIADSERFQDTAHSDQNMTDSTMTITTLNGSQAVDVRVRTQNGSISILNRSLLLTRLGT